MIDGFKVDHSELGRVAAILRDAGRELDSLGSSMPGAPDAGDVSAGMAAAIGHLTGSASELVLGVLESGGRVAEAGARYAAQDGVAGRTLRGLE